MGFIGTVETRIEEELKTDMIQGYRALRQPRTAYGELRRPLASGFSEPDEVLLKLKGTSSKK